MPEAFLGEEAPDQLMQPLPRTPGDRLATRTDLRSTATALRGRMAGLVAADAVAALPT